MTNITYEMQKDWLLSRAQQQLRDAANAGDTDWMAEAQSVYDTILATPATTLASYTYNYSIDDTGAIRLTLNT